MGSTYPQTVFGTPLHETKKTQYERSPARHILLSRVANAYLSELRRAHCTQSGQDGVYRAAGSRSIHPRARRVEYRRHTTPARYARPCHMYMACVDGRRLLRQKRRNKTTLHTTHNPHTRDRSHHPTSEVPACLSRVYGRVGQTPGVDTIDASTHIRIELLPERTVHQTRACRIPGTGVRGNSTGTGEGGSQRLVDVRNRTVRSVTIAPRPNPLARAWYQPA